MQIETICKKCQSLFSGKNQETVINLLSFIGLECGFCGKSYCYNLFFLCIIVKINSKYCINLTLYMLRANSADNILQYFSYFS